MKYNYLTLKDLGKDLKRSVKTLLALSPNNDPFYCGMPAQIDKAKWFADLWQQFGYTSGVHLRRMHYQIVSQNPPIKMVNGKPYAMNLKHVSSRMLRSVQLSGLLYVQT